MPYIKKDRRDDFHYDFDGAESPQNVGELNYLITLLCKDYLRAQGVNYTNINGVIGVLECAKLEFYRRLASPYEDTKIKENGDVY